jgi:hypothetical protein
MDGSNGSVGSASPFNHKRFWVFYYILSYFCFGPRRRVLCWTEKQAVSDGRILRRLHDIQRVQLALF